MTAATGAVTQPFAELMANSKGASSSSNTSASAAATAANTQANIEKAQKSLTGDQQTFLKLLTTQLKNQDPLSPMDANQFTQQLVVMNGVQQQILTNQLLQQLVGQRSSMDPVNLIGKQVTAEVDDAVLAGGQANWAYSLETPAKTVTLQVLDSKNKVVFEKDLTNQAAGEQTLAWDGKGRDGATLADGTYTLKVTATDSANAAVASHIYQRGQVTAVETANGMSLLRLNGLKIPLSTITNIAAVDAQA